MNPVHVVVPAGIDDPAQVSGGNRYDRRLCDGLRSAGWTVPEIVAPGSWPRPDAAALEGLRRSLAAVPDGRPVLVDGLVGSAAGEVLLPAAARLRLVVLVHLPFGGDAVPEREESAVLGAASAVVTTSEWTRGSLLGRYPLDPARVHVATPGTDAVPVAPGTPDGGRLLCVAAVAPHKGHDVLVDALAGVEGPWRCTVVGSPDRDPPFAARLERRAVAAGIAERIRYTGPRVDEDLLREHGGADLLVVPSRGETYGMVVAEALAAGLPVLATGVGGVPEALGRTAAGRPGMLVPPGDPGALAAALTRWLTDPGLRCRLRHAARARRPSLPSWQATSDRVGEVLTAVLGEPDPLSLRVPR